MKKRQVPQQLKNRHTIEFVRAFRELLRLLKAATLDTDPVKFWTKAHILLAGLYYHGAALPKVAPTSYASMRSDPRRNVIYSEKLLHSPAIHRLLACVGDYSVVYDPYDPTSVCVAGAWDEFYDICSDLWDDYLLWRTRDSVKMLLAVYKWKDTIDLHAGNHAASLIKALRWYLQNNRTHIAVGETFGLKNRDESLKRLEKFNELPLKATKPRRKKP